MGVTVETFQTKKVFFPDFWWVVDAVPPNIHVESVASRPCKGKVVAMVSDSGPLLSLQLEEYFNDNSDDFE